jgi:hypothetical protein
MKYKSAYVANNFRIVNELSKLITRDKLETNNKNHPAISKAEIKLFVCSFPTPLSLRHNDMNENDKTTNMAKKK